MVKILVIGNGFDKAHGLKTGYGDFLKWIQYIVGKDDPYIRSGEHPITKEELQESTNIRNNYPGIFREIKENKDNFWIFHFIKIENELGPKWLDFESEIERVTKGLFNDENVTFKNVASPLKRISSRELQIPKFVNEAGVFEWLEDELNKTRRLLEIYLCLCANNTIGNDARLPLFSHIKANKLISFNYTMTYQNVYNKTISTDYIHGRARLNHKKNEICNLVLGFDDHYFDSANTIQALIPFEKYYQRIVYRNSNEYFNWIDAKDKYGNDEEKEVHFYGHSMSPADGDIIRLLIEGENTKTKIYYRKDHEEDRASMIKNLAIILTPNGLIKRMGGRNPTIELISI